MVCTLPFFRPGGEWGSMLLLSPPTIGRRRGHLVCRQRMNWRRGRGKSSRTKPFGIPFGTPCWISQSAGVHLWELWCRAQGGGFIDEPMLRRCLHD